MCHTGQSVRSKDWMVIIFYYDEERDLAFCFPCVKAYYKDNKLHGVNSLEYTYISTGYSNWKDSSVRLPAHEAMVCHKIAILKIVTLPATTRDVHM